MPPGFDTLTYEKITAIVQGTLGTSQRPDLHTHGRPRAVYELCQFAGQTPRERHGGRAGIENMLQCVRLEGKRKVDEERGGRCRPEGPDAIDGEIQIRPGQSQRAQPASIGDGRGQPDGRQAADWRLKDRPFNTEVVSNT